MSSCTTSISGQGGGRRFLTLGIYILVVFGFFMNAHIVHHFSTGCVPSPAPATTHHENEIKKIGALSDCGAFSTSVPICQLS